MTVRFHFAPESAACTLSQPQTLRATSAEIGWTSVLLDETEGSGRSEVFDTVVTPDLGIVVAIAGSHRLEAFRNGIWHSAVYQPGAARLTAGGEPNTLRWEATPEQSSFKMAHLYVPAALVMETAEEYRRAGKRVNEHPLHALVFKDPLITHTIAAMLNAMQEQAAELYAEEAARWLVTHLLSSHAQWWEPAVDNRSAGLLEDRRLARSLEYMSANLDKPLSLGEIAREAGISVHHFGRLFRARVGLTPFAYLTLLRGQCAERLLRTTDMTIAEIAVHCGYVSSAAFTTAFARAYGMPPSHFRKRDDPAPL